MKGDIADSTGKKAKKSSLNYKSAHRTSLSHDASVKQKTNKQTKTTIKITVKKKYVQPGQCGSAVEHRPRNQEVASSVPGQATGLSCRLHPQQVTSKELNNKIHNTVTWVVAAVTSIHK
ncbi:fibrous sheath-interacting protein 2-like [Eptesicus fuscus]|uniref:fibrous sheath-interacting protein 2-like n=1 Tax=Eptesicus fuscus TaxID=29078 RepID=UPI002403ED2B|nr:fibrous sheath-interacting protein 2-like [Eptesicus fuscus]